MTNRSGRLGGLRFSANFYEKSDDSLFNVFNHFQISLQISKLLGRGIIPFMPEWLDLRVNAGAGVDITFANYYKTESAKESGSASEGVAAAGVYNFALFAEMNNFEFDSDDDSLSTELIIPYVGFNLEMMTDQDGLMLMPSVALGVRTTVARVLGITPDLYKGNPGLTARVRQATFSPDNDGKSDILKMDIRTKLYDGASIKNWVITVFSPKKKK
jgi:hypothetical protein